MPQLQNVVLTDRAATPVNHTYVPRDIVNGVGSVIESTGVAVGDNSLSVSLTKTAAGRRKAKINLVLPIVQNQVLNGITTPVVVRTTYVTVEFSFDPTSSTQERKDALGLIASALAPGKVLIENTVVNLEGVY